MRNKTILLAEDSAPQRRLLQYAVNEVAGTHATLETVSRGDEIRSYLEGDGDYRDRSAYPYPDLILLDLNMPGMNGFDVLAWARTHSDAAGVPIVILSSTQDVVAINRAYRLGADGYLKKPVNYDELIDIVRCLHWMLAEGGKSLEQLRSLPGYRDASACYGAD